MRSLLVILRIIIVGCLWGIVFTEGIRVIMLCNWHFDIFWPDHWRQAYELWQAGWVVRAPKEWAFVIIIITYFPMLITGWWTLSLVAWEKLLWKLITLPVTLYRRYIKAPINVITTNNKYGVVKRKSYKQIRPTGVAGGIRSPISDYSDSSHTPAPAYPSSSMAAQAVMSSPYTATTPRPAAPKPTKTDVAATIEHALFKFDDDDDDDFDLDIDSFEKADISKKRQNKEEEIEEKPAPRRSFAEEFDFDDDEDEPDERPRRDNRRNSRRNEDDEDRPRSKARNERGERADRSERSEKAEKSKRNSRTTRESSDNNDEKPATATQGPVYDALQQKGYDIISNVKAKGVTVDFVGVSDTQICLCLVDKENGDWLADEELFNGEEPLWFSESSHRVSPVRRLSIARDAIKDKLEAEGFAQELKAFVVVQMANIINADDMFDIWQDMNIDVTRINRGAPKEIRLFSKTLTEAEKTLPHREMDRLRKTLKSLSE